MQRKNDILRAGVDHFGRFGYSGASLRDIARDSRVSLALLNHHFGRKAGVFRAVVEAHGGLFDARAAAVRRVTALGAGGLSAERLVLAWIRVGLETAAARDGTILLRLLARVGEDRSDECINLLRARLDDTARVFIDALQQCHPQAPRSAVASAYLFVDATLAAFFLDGNQSGSATAGERHDGRAGSGEVSLARFLLAGVEVTLGPYRAGGRR